MEINGDQQINRVNLRMKCKYAVTFYLNSSNYQENCLEWGCLIQMENNAMYIVLK